MSRDQPLAPLRPKVVSNMKIAMKLCTSFGTRLGTQVCDFSARYLGGARSIGFATLRNVSKMLPNVPKLLWN